MIPNKPGITLQRAVAESQVFQGWLAENDKHMRWYEVALKLRGYQEIPLHMQLVLSSLHRL